jgi:hypothetical protein
MSDPKHLVFLFILAILLPTGISARTWYITVDGTGDLPTIQAAIDSAAVGDTILLAPGHYTWTNQGTGDHRGFLRFYTYDHHLTVRSEMGPEVTILDAEFRSRVIYCAANNWITFEGLTITRGEAPEWGDYWGGGFLTHITRDKIRNCIFVNNRAVAGGAICCVLNDGTFDVENCTFIDNETSDYGGAMAFVNGYGMITVTDCTIQNNQTDGNGGAIFQHNCPADITDCVITDNEAGGEGGALHSHRTSSMNITGCTIAGNSSNGAVISSLYDNVFSFRKTIIAYNTGRAFDTDSTMTGDIGCCVIYGNTGDETIPEGFVETGLNIYLDPLFCGVPGSGNYYLRSDSPCTPLNHPGGLFCQLIGALPVACGSVSTETKSWSEIKKLFQ